MLPLFLSWERYPNNTPNLLVYVLFMSLVTEETVRPRGAPADSDTRPYLQQVWRFGQTSKLRGVG